MVMKFETKSLKTPENRAFYTAVAAAEHFMKLRMNGRYHDLIALIQFGNEAYVVTPFTTDYENIMLSIRLISSPKEWGSFNDWGTTIMQGLNQTTQLFRAFDFVNAAGNAALIFTDGRDDEKNLKGKSIDTVIDDMKKYKIPVYMIRTGFDLKEGQIPTDKLWKPLVERTGGRFYAADSEDVDPQGRNRNRQAGDRAHRRSRIHRAAAAVRRLRAHRHCALAERRCDETGVQDVQDVSVTT